MFLALINASKFFRSHFVLLFAFSGTRPSANSESSSSLANVEAFGRSLDAGGGAVRVVYSRDGRDSWVWQIKKRTTRTVGPLPHPETVCIVGASHFSLELKYFSSTLLC